MGTKDTEFKVPCFPIAQQLYQEDFAYMYAYTISSRTMYWQRTNFILVNTVRTFRLFIYLAHYLLQQQDVYHEKEDSGQ